MTNTNNNTNWTPPCIAVQPIKASALPEALALIERLQSQNGASTASNPFGEAALLASTGKAQPEQWVLQLGDELPRLIRPDGVHWNIDYRQGKARHRAAEPNRAHQPLARALGLSKLTETERQQWHVADGTAGAGSDGWQLAATGACVTLIEQHPVLFTMLTSAVKAALNHPPTQPIAEKINVINSTIEGSMETLHSSVQGPINAVYLDPMYPVRRSKAAVKKPMQFIQALVGKGPEPTAMLEHCLQAFNHHTSLNRVVVKRPSEAAAMIGKKDWHGQLVSVDAGAARFDIYLNPAP